MYAADVQPIRKNTNRGVGEVIVHDAPSARRYLTDARVAEAKLFEQVSVVTTEHVGGLFRSRERRDRVSLGKHYRGGQVMGERVVLGWIARAMFPMTRTGVLSFVRVYAGSLSTERTGHLNEM